MLARKKNLAVGDNGVSFTPVTDTWTARSLLMLCFVHVVSSLKLVIYHDCHIYVIWADCATHAIYIPWHSIGYNDFLSIALFLIGSLSDLDSCTAVFLFVHTMC